jgi:hypothetical protein
MTKEVLFGSRASTPRGSEARTPPTPAPAPAPDPNGWVTSPPAVMVKVQDIQDTSHAHLNGQFGVVLWYAADRARYTVQMSISQAVVSLWVGNLRKYSLDSSPTLPTLPTTTTTPKKSTRGTSEDFFDPRDSSDDSSDDNVGPSAAPAPQQSVTQARTPRGNEARTPRAPDPNGWVTSPPSVMVKVQDIQDTRLAEHNGHEGVVLRYDFDMREYEVEMSISQDVVWLESANLRQASDTPHDGSDGNRLPTPPTTPATPTPPITMPPATDPNGWATSPPSVMVKVQDTIAHLNGQLGVVLQYAADRALYTVQMSISQDVVSLKAANLRNTSDMVDQIHDTPNDGSDGNGPEFTEEQQEQFIADLSPRSYDADVRDLVFGGWYYLRLPFPPNLETPKDDQTVKTASFAHATKLLQFFQADFIALLAGSDVGYGNDPERLDERLLNTKAPILDTKFFATALASASIHEIYRSAYTVELSCALTKNNKIDYGASGGYAGVSLGFKRTSESEEISEEKHVVGVTDNTYKWATTEVGIERTCLHKYITKECQDHVQFIQDKLENGREDNDESRANLTFAEKRVEKFIAEYGTHMVLKSSHGYRHVTASETTVRNKQELQRFNRSLELSALSYATATLSAENDVKKQTNSSTSLEGAWTVGSKGNFERAIKGDIEGSKWLEHCGHLGDAGVISHDETMAIFDLVRLNPDYELASEALRYWTFVRVRDLQQGWKENVMAMSYKLFFRDSCPDNAGVYVTIDAGDEGNVSYYHECPKKQGSKVSLRTEFPRQVGHVAEVADDDARGFKIQSIDGSNLKEILSEVWIYRRCLVWDDDGNVEGEVSKTVEKIFEGNTGSMHKMDLEKESGATCSIGEARTELLGPVKPEGEEREETCWTKLCGILSVRSNVDNVEQKVESTSTTEVR